MAKSVSRSREKRPSTEPRSAAPVEAFDRARPWLLAGAALLCVARPLIPSIHVELQGNDAPFVMLWLILFSLSLALLWRQGEAWLRAEFIDLALLVTVALYAASGLVACWNGAAPRPAINMTWTWIGYGAAFFVVRQLLRTPAEARALAAVMIALAATSCGYALHEYFISQPATVAEYERDPEAALRDAGMWFPPGSRERYLFEQRLHSIEPTATFALTNSLAGFLTPWLLVLAGAIVTLPARLGSRKRILSTFAATGAALLLVLLLTKSRSAVVGLSAGAALLALSPSIRRHLFTRRAAAIVGLLLVVIVVAVATGGVDIEVLAEAPKSLAYRFEYWRASWSLIAAQPVWGVGPGEFKDAYSTVKLPTASEEISDPHNFVLEIWSTAGTLVAAAFVGFLLSVFWRTWPSLRGSEDPAPATAPSAAARAADRSARMIAWGGLAGFLLAFLVPFFAGPVIDVPLSLVATVGGLAISGTMLWLLWPWVADGVLPPLVPLAALVGMTVNLLAAGGIGHPGVAGSLWLLAALATTLRDLDEPATTTSMPRLQRLGPTPLALATCLALFLSVAAAATLYHPLVMSQLAIAAAQAEPNRAEEFLDEAIAADPFGYDAPRRMAQLRFEQWRRQPSELSRKSFAAAADLWLERRPGSSEAWSQVGAWQMTIFEQTADPQAARAALEACRRAVELYPHQGVRRARLALAASAAGDRTTAQAEASEAFRLDAIMPHAEQKLDETLRARLKELVPNASDDGQRSSSADKM
ncbi:MAG: O-antigen ligase family protein [Pirellulales bacterium]|nr:O-antigen ligase family protein [Pirellulales bacterium]